MKPKLEERMRIEWKDLSRHFEIETFVVGEDAVYEMSEQGKEIEEYFTNNPDLIERCLDLLDSEERIDMVSFRIDVPLKKYEKEYDRDFEFLVQIEKRPDLVYELNVNKLDSWYASAKVIRAK
ncbi:hypothetical protein KY348_02345 [Candidatus Woesearchaeota archaeon]|nr:hypothetical protein [Candidatus Woesearchaeota archaeon]